MDAMIAFPIAFLLQAVLAFDPRIDPESKATALDPRYHSCPKVFVPGRAGGFLLGSGMLGCCLAGRALALGEVIREIHSCTHFQVISAQRMCYRSTLMSLTQNMNLCCTQAGGVRRVLPSPKDLELCHKRTASITAKLRKALHWFKYCAKGDKFVSGAAAKIKAGGCRGASKLTADALRLSLKAAHKSITGADRTQLSSQFLHAAQHACGVNARFIARSKWDGRLQGDWRGSARDIELCWKQVHSWALRHDLSLAW